VLGYFDDLPKPEFGFEPPDISDFDTSNKNGIIESPLTTRFLSNL